MSFTLNQIFVLIDFDSSAAEYSTVFLFGTRIPVFLVN